MIKEEDRTKINKFLLSKTKDEVQEISDYVNQFLNREIVTKNCVGKYYCLKDSLTYTEVFRITKVNQATIEECPNQDIVFCEGDYFSINKLRDENYTYNVHSSRFGQYSVDFLNKNEISKEKFLKVANAAIEKMLGE